MTASVSSPSPASAIRPPAGKVIDARGRSLAFGEQTLVMGILNVTPDSFSDGGRSAALDDALANAARMVEEGADILDIGGESTRPGHTPVPLDEELARVLPVIERLGALGVPVSIDTQKAKVAEAALAFGVGIVNDIWGLMGDPDMARVVAAHDAAVVAMHNRSVVDPSLDIVADIIGFFEQSLERAAKAGIRADRIVLDPGIGFGKTFEQNLTAIASLRDIGSRLGFPLLLGTSRKSLIGKVVATEPRERLPGTIASNVLGIAAGCAIIRVHDVAAHVQAARVTEAIIRAA